MEVSIIGLSYRTQTSNKNSLFSDFFIKTEIITPFLNECYDYEKNIKIFCCGNSVKNKTPEKDCAKTFKYINFEFTLTGTPL